MGIGAPRGSRRAASGAPLFLILALGLPQLRAQGPGRRLDAVDEDLVDLEGVDREPGIPVSFRVLPSTIGSGTPVISVKRSERYENRRFSSSSQNQS